MELLILINGYIGDLSEFMTGVNFFTLADLENLLTAITPETKSVNVKINSGGGFITEGFAIHDRLAALDIPVNTEILGRCGSIATVISQAPKTQNKGGVRAMHQNSEFFIHNPLWVPQGPVPHNANDLDAIANDLRTEEKRIVDFYKLTSTANESWLTSKMEKETTLTAKEAEENGFIDKVIGQNIVSYNTYKLVALTNTNKNDMKGVKEEISKGFIEIAKLINAALGKKTTALNVKTAEGAEVYYEGTLAEGSKLFSDPEMTTPAPDGAHTIDGKKYTVAGGVVSKIEDASVDTKTDIEKANEKLAALEQDLINVRKEKDDAVSALAQKDTAINLINTNFTALKQKIETGGKEIFTDVNTDTKERKESVGTDWKAQAAERKRLQEEAKK